MKIVKYKVINNINIPYDRNSAIACKRGDFIHIVESVVFYNNIYRQMIIPIATIKANPLFFEEVKTIEGALLEMPYQEYNFDYNDNTYCKIFYNFRDDIGRIKLTLIDIRLIMVRSSPVRNESLPIEYIKHLERIEKLNDILA